MARTDQLTVSNSTADRPTLVLIDGFGLIFRAYYAIKNEITTSRGENVNAVFGFASMLLDVLRREQPEYAIIAMESGRTFRDEAYAEYKANRGAMPDDLRPQVERVLQVIHALNIPLEVRDGYEADDVIGSLARQCGERGDVRVIIVTGDSDLLQLVDENTTVVLPGALRFGDLRYFGPDEVQQRYGFGPEHVADYKALVGDTSDNIPGVAGIGEKTAKALIAQFGGIEEIIAHVDEVNPARARNAVQAGIEDARFSKRLTTIVRNLPIDIDLERSHIGNYDREAAIALFRELEFRTLATRLPEPRRDLAPAPRKEERPPSQRTIVRTAEELDQLVRRVRAARRFAIDVETDSLDPLTANLVGIAVGVSPSEGYYIPLRHAVGDVNQLDLDAVLVALQPLLVDGDLEGYAHHAKYDLAVLLRHGYEWTNLGFETMIAAYLLGETSGRLKDLSFTRLGREMTEIVALIGTGSKQLTMDMVDSDLAGDYACGDVESTFELADLFRPEIHAAGMDALLHEIEQPLVPILAEMEATGIAIDVPYLHQLSTEITGKLDQVETELQELAGRPINPNSARQLAPLLFEELKLPSGRKTKTGFSVDSEVLENIRHLHPIADLILEHRTLAKLKSTYVDALPLQVNALTGRVHTSFNQTVAATGRLSSTNPNLQNIPIRTELGRRVRRAFVADSRAEFRIFDDPVLLAADYSQLELRLLAHITEEPFLIDAFARGEDIHRATAAIIHGVPTDEVTADMRRVAKTVNFGLIYGMQAHGLSRDSGLTLAQAQEFINQYWANLPRVKRYFDDTLAFGIKHGYVESRYGRRRILGDLTSANYQRRAAAERMAVNMPIQGTAADIMKMAMIALDRDLADSGLRAKLLLQVHDELVLEVDRHDAAGVAALVRSAMEEVVELKVPLETEVRAGPNWDDLTPIANLIAHA
ncbi:MAG: DNA polymerase I [Thermomicrobiales bacterium]